MRGGTPAAILPTSSSACIIFLMRAAGKRGLSPFGGMLCSVPRSGRAPAPPPREKREQQEKLAPNPAIQHLVHIAHAIKLSAFYSRARTPVRSYHFRKHLCSSIFAQRLVEARKPPGVGTGAGGGSPRDCLTCRLPQQIQQKCRAVCMSS